jgi:hypothetical protein
MKKSTLLILFITGLASSINAQKGEKNIFVGPLVSLPVGGDRFGSTNLKPGLGLEVSGQYGLSDPSALLVQAGFTSWRYKESVANFYQARSLNFLIIHGGYRYYFGSSGFFINGLAGVDIDLDDSFTTISFNLGAGKRIKINENRNMDLGLDFIGADAENRVNIKALFNIWK